jgi:iron complex transport system substrate-binding protein
MRPKNCVVLLFTSLLVLSVRVLQAGTATDSIGQTISVPDRGGRVVSLSPGATETLFALGVRGQLVGVSDFCDHPPGLVGEKPSVGGFSTPSLEKIQVLDPHVVISTTVIPIDIKAQLENMGIDLFVANPKSFEQYLESVRQLGLLLGREEQAAALIRGFEERVGRITAALEAAGSDPVRTFIEIYDIPLFAAGPETLPGDLVRLAGGEVVPDTGEEYPRLSDELLLVLNPRAVVLGHNSSLEQFLSRHRNVERIDAIRNRRIFNPDPDEFLRSGPRMVDALERIARFLHPEVIGSLHSTVWPLYAAACRPHPVVVGPEPLP